jgi:hypothetical protein
MQRSDHEVERYLDTLSLEDRKKFIDQLGGRKLWEVEPYEIPDIADRNIATRLSGARTATDRSDVPVSTSAPPRPAVPDKPDAPRWLQLPAISGAVRERFNTVTADGVRSDGSIRPTEYVRT